MQLSCPKCRAPMASLERRGVTVEECTQCRGMFLDKGEVEHLVLAEAAWYAPATPPGPPPPVGPHVGQHPRPHRRRGFLGDILDIAAQFGE